MKMIYKKDDTIGLLTSNFLIVGILIVMKEF